MKSNFFFYDFFVDLFFEKFMRTEFCKFDQISKNSKNKYIQKFIPMNFLS